MKDPIWGDAPRNFVLVISNNARKLPSLHGPVKQEVKFGLSLVMKISSEGELITLVNSLKADHDAVASLKKLGGTHLLHSECHVYTVCFLVTS